MKLIVFFTVLATVALIVACGSNTTVNVNTANRSSNTAAASTSDPVTSASNDEMASAKKLYTDNCAKCHKDDGTGGKVTVEGRTMEPDNLTDKRRKALSDEKIIKFIHDGIEDEGMPAYKDKLSQDEMKQIVRYVRVEIQKMPEGVASTTSGGGNINSTSANTNSK